MRRFFTPIFSFGGSGELPSDCYRHGIAGKQKMVEPPGVEPGTS
jgi:hypothetical protein